MLKNPAPALWVSVSATALAPFSRRRPARSWRQDLDPAHRPGPYVFKDWKPKEQFVLEANPDLQRPGHAAFQQITQDSSRNRRPRCSPIANEIALTEVDPTSQDELKKKTDGRGQEDRRHRLSVDRINVEKPPLTTSKSARRSAMQSTSMRSSPAPTTTPCRAPQSAGTTPARYWKDTLGLQHDPTKPKALLAEAGQTNISLTLTSLNDATSQAIAQIAHGNLAEAGINVTLKPWTAAPMGTGTIMTRARISN